MTKTLKPIDHIGWDLWRATQVWKRDLTREMIARGFDWYGESRGLLIGQIGVRGIAQSELAARTNTSKQAVQQQLDELVRDGFVRRSVDPADARKKMLELTRDGRQVLEAITESKLEIENRYQKRMGPEQFAKLKSGLNMIIEDDQAV